MQRGETLMIVVLRVDEGHNIRSLYKNAKVVNP